MPLIKQLRTAALFALILAVSTALAQQTYSLSAGSVCSKGSQCISGACINNRCATSEEARAAVQSLAGWAIAVLVISVLACLSCIAVCVCYCTRSACFKRRDNVGQVITTVQPAGYGVAPQPGAYGQPAAPQPVGSMNHQNPAYKPVIVNM